MKTLSSDTLNTAKLNILTLKDVINLIQTDSDTSSPEDRLIKLVRIMSSAEQETNKSYDQSDSLLAEENDDTKKNTVKIENLLQNLIDKIAMLTSALNESMVVIQNYLYQDVVTPIQKNLDNSNDSECVHIKKVPSVEDLTLACDLNMLDKTVEEGNAILSVVEQKNIEVIDEDKTCDEGNVLLSVVEQKNIEVIDEDKTCDQGNALLRVVEQENVELAKDGVADYEEKEDQDACTIAQAYLTEEEILEETKTKPEFVIEEVAESEDLAISGACFVLNN